MAWRSSSVFKESPLFKKIKDTAKYLMVISGIKIPPFFPMLGSIFAMKIAMKSPSRNQFLMQAAAKAVARDAMSSCDPRYIESLYI